MPNKLRNMRLNEVSLVDNPANKSARVSIWKRYGDGGRLIDIAKADREPLVRICKDIFSDSPDQDFRAALSEEMQRQQMMEVREEMFPLMDALQESVMASATNLSGEDRDQKIRQNVEAFLEAVRAKLDGQNMEGAKAAMNAVLKAGSPGNSTPSNNGGTMTEETEKGLGDLKVQVNQLTKQLEAVQTEVEKHGLEMKKSDDGSVAVEKQADDEVTTDPDGRTIRKSEVGASTFAVIKAQNDRIAKMETEREAEQFAKQAEDRLPNVGGDARQKGAILKAVQSISDEDTRNAALGHLDTLNKMLGEHFVEKGHSGSPDAGSEAMTKLDNLAKERAEKTGESKEVAYYQVIKTDQGAQLYDQYLRERAQ